MANSFTLTEVINTAIQIPGVKVDKESFLREQFKKERSAKIERIIKYGTIGAGCTRQELNKAAKHLINERTMFSSAVAFAAGIPGGLAMAVAIPADILQFYGMVLRMAQELAYLYGEDDLWNGNTIDNEKVTNQLILYCGAMLGVSGATQAVRILSSKLAQQALTKLPQKALTKTFYYPIIKSVAAFFGTKITKDVFAKGVSKAVPVIGGVVSGGITFASMCPMGIRLAEALDEAHFDYTQEEFEADWQVILKENEEETEEGADKNTASTFELKETNSPIERLKNAREMFELGLITEDEFDTIKNKIISEL